MNYNRNKGSNVRDRQSISMKLLMHWLLMLTLSRMRMKLNDKLVNLTNTSEKLMPFELQKRSK